LAEHHAQMKTTSNLRRCAQCNAEFVPDPRIGSRQDTCGGKECQRLRHAKLCRQWRAANVEATSSHYQDAVVPFRQRQPDYQRRWRWGRKLREIREQTGQFGGALLAPLLGPLRSLISRAQELANRAVGLVQTGVLAGKLLIRATQAARTLLTALEQLQASSAELGALGL
jgi:hypothetical protein